jgi:hypothetical protein
MVEVEVFVLVDSDGNVTAGAGDADAVRDRHHEETAALDAVLGYRMVVVRLKVPRPSPLVVMCVVPEEPAVEVVS